MPLRATRPLRRVGWLALVAVGTLLFGWPLVAGPTGRFSRASAATGAQDVGTPSFWNNAAAAPAPITGGGSTMGFKLGNSTAPGVLPGGTGAGGACPGDTATDQYNVWTYLTYDNNTNGGAPATLTLGSSGGSFATGPAGYGHEPPTPALPLADPTGAAWGGPSSPEPTAVKTAVVINLPTFQFAPFYSGDFEDGTAAQAAAAGKDLFPGKWDLGVACTAPGGPAVTNYWNAQIVITAVPVGTGSGQDPNGFTWAVATQSPPPPSTTTTTTARGATTTSPSSSSTSTPGGSTSTTSASGGSTTTLGASGIGATGGSTAGGTGGTGSEAGGTGSSGAAGIGTGTTADPSTLAATGSPTGKEGLIGLLVLLIGARLVLLARRLPLRAAGGPGGRRSQR